MDIVCDSCSVQLRVPEERVGDRGAKLKCPSCGTTLVIFPAEHVAMAEEAEPTTEDWSSSTLSDDGGVPAAIKRLFTHEQIHPPGTEPPVLRQVAPRPVDHTLSVTPPPPRAARAPLTPTATVLRASRPAVTQPPPSSPKRFTNEPPPVRSRVSPIPPPALLDSPSRGTPAHLVRASVPPPRPRAAPEPASETTTQPPASERAAATSAIHTAPGPQNRTGPTGGPSPHRAEAQAQQGPPMSYAPPWGASWNTAGGTPAGPPYPAYPPPNYTPGAPPPWQPQMMAYPTTTGTPAPSYSGPWTGTPPPVGPTGGPPMFTMWQPTWMPAIVLGMERTTLAMLLGVVLIVGFVGSCLGVGSARLMPSDNRPLYVAPTMVPGTEVVPGEHRPRPVAPRPMPADRTR